MFKCFKFVSPLRCSTTHLELFSMDQRKRFTFKKKSLQITSPTSKTPPVKEEPPCFRAPLLSYRLDALQSAREK